MRNRVKRQTEEGEMETFAAVLCQNRPVDILFPRRRAITLSALCRLAFFPEHPSDCGQDGLRKDRRVYESGPGSFGHP